MPDTASDILAPSDPTWNPPPDATPAPPQPPSVQDAMNAGGQNTMQPDAGPPTPTGYQMTTNPADTMPAPKPPDVQEHEGWMHRVLDKVGGILGGDTTVHVTKDKDGNVTVTHDPSTTGEKWARVAAAAIGGAAKGIENSQGPGGLARAGAAGAEFGLQQPQKRQEQADAQATAEQKRQMLAAQNVLIHQQGYRAMLESQGLKLDIDAKSAATMNSYRDDLASDPNATDYGVISSPEDLTRIATANADFLHHHTNLQLKSALVPKKGGGGFEIHAIASDPGEDMQPIKPGTMMPTIEVDPKTGKPSLSDTPASKGQKQGAFNIARSAVITKFADLTNKYATAHAKDNPPPKNPTEASLAWDAQNNPDPNVRAQARRAVDLMKEKPGTGTSETSGFDPQASLQQNAQMMVDGLASPSMMSKRSKDYNQLLPLAQQYSLQKYGQPFDAEISEARYQARKEVLQQAAGGKPADQIQSFQTFANHAQNLMNDVADLRNTNIKLLNMPYNKLRDLSGNPAVIPVKTHIAALRREYQNFLSNNMALKGEEIKEGKEIMDDTQSPAQMEAAAKSFMTTAIGRVSALNNRFLRFDVPIGGEILTPQNRQTIRNMGLGDYADQMIRPQPQGPAMFNQGQPGQPTPTPQPTPAPVQTLDQSNPPPIEKVPPGVETTFKNGQVWRNVNGKAQRIK